MPFDSLSATTFSREKFSSDRESMVSIILAVFAAFATGSAVHFTHRERIFEARKWLAGRILYALSPSMLNIYLVQILAFMAWCHVCPSAIDAQLLIVLVVGLGAIFAGLAFIFLIVSSVVPELPQSSDIGASVAEEAPPYPKFFRSVLERPPQTCG